MPSFPGVTYLLDRRGLDHRAFRNRVLIVKKIVLATALLALGSATAFAADLPARTYTKAPMMAPINTWQGFYIGGNVGYGWGNETTDILPSGEDQLFLKHHWTETSKVYLAARNSAIIGN
jgi:hypothetical protein